MAPAAERIMKKPEPAKLTQLVIPEFDVTNLEQSLAFYTQVIGFAVLYARPEEKFAFLDLDGAQIMLEEAVGPGRRFRTAPLEHPYGRGINVMAGVSTCKSRSPTPTRFTRASVQPSITSSCRWRKNDIGATKPCSATVSSLSPTRTVICCVFLLILGRGRCDSVCATLFNTQMILPSPSKGGGIKPGNFRQHV